MAEPRPAEDTVEVYAPGLGVRRVPKSEVAAAEAEGSHRATPGEIASADKEKAAEYRNLTPGDVAKGYGETWLAGHHAAYRGIGEAFGVPVDSGIAALFGPEGAKYARELDEKHPYVSGVTGFVGQVHGSLGAAELLGPAAGRISGGLPRTAGAIATRVATGGVENVIQATTHDINEGALGKADVNGEKLLAQIPKHFIVGAALTGLFEGGAAALSRAPLAGAAEAADKSASRFVGRELGETGAAAEAAGERVRGLIPDRGVPRGPSHLVEILGGEQTALRGRAEAERAAKLGEVGAEFETKAGVMAGRHAAERDAAAEAIRAAESRTAPAGPTVGRPLEEVTAHYGALRETLANEHAAASELATRIGAERAANKAEIKSLLDHAKTPEAKQAADLIRQMDKADAQRDAGERWFRRDTGAGGERELRPMQKTREGDWRPMSPETPEGAPAKLSRDERRGAVAVGLTGEREAIAAMAADREAKVAAKKAEQDALDAKLGELTKLVQSQIEKAGGSVTPSHAEQLTRLQALGKDLDKAHEGALAHAKQVATAIKQTDAQAAAEIAHATAEAERQAVQFHRGVKEAQGAASNVGKAQSAEQAALEGARGKAEKAVPKASKKTEIDPLLARAQEGASRAAQQPLVSGQAGIGAVLSLAHGHPLGAAASLLSSLAAGRIRAHGNFVAASSLRAVSESLAAADAAIRRGAAGVIGQIGARTATAGERAATQKHPALKFENVAEQVLAAKTNPQLIELHVRQALGPIALEAPATYTQTLEAAKRAQLFLESILPPPQVDTHTLTPHLQKPTLSNTEKWEFMESVHAIDDPMSLLRRVKDGSLTEQHVEAVSFVYPQLYAQMKGEVMSHISQATSPIDYKREIQIGILLGQDTNEVLDRDFQSSLSAAYKAKAQSGQAAGSKPKSGESKVSKDMMSASQQLERGAM